MPSYHSHRIRSPVRSPAIESTSPTRHGLILLLVGLLGLSGCATRWRRPISETVIASRQSAMRGMEAESHNKWDEAEAMYRKAIEECPANEQARRRYADALWRRGQRTEAFTEMTEAVRLSGGDPEMTTQLGEMYLAIGHVDQAERLADRAINLDRHRADAWALRGDVHRRRGDAYEALANYHRALSYQPGLERVQVSVAEIYRQQGKPNRALATVDAIIDRYPPQQAPQFALQLRGMALQDLGRHQAAVESLLAAVQRGEPTPDLYHQLAEAQTSLGDVSSAHYALQESLRLNPSHAPSQALLARLSEGTPQVASTIQR